MHDFDVRLAAYGVIVVDERILLARFVQHGAPAWTLPGGGLERGEDGPTAALREVREETGYIVELEGLLGVHSLQVPPPQRMEPGSRHLHALRLVYRARIVGGELRHETNGSTDEARWFDVEAVPALTRVPLVDEGLRLLRAATS